MKLTDALSLIGLVLVVVLLLHAARHGPMEPVYEAITGQAPALVEPGPAVTPDAADEEASRQTIARRLR